MSKHDQYQEARLALESGVAAVENIIRDRDVETRIAQLRLDRLLGLIERDRLVREWFEAFSGEDHLGPSEWFKLEVLLETRKVKQTAHDDSCEADWGAEGQESPCRCAEVRAGVVAEDPEWEYGVRLTEGPERHQGSEYIYQHASLAIAEDQAALNPEYQAEYFTRRKAGPWEPVGGVTS